MKRKPLAEWRAIRALVEGARGTVELVAQASGRSARIIAITAEREGWRLDRMPEEDLSEKLRVVSGMLLDRVETLGRKALEEGAKINKSEIDGLLSIIKGLDRVAGIARPEEAAKEKQIRRDEDRSEVLKRINERIVELAQELADKMVRERDRPARG